jgi:RND family efflux transporter MFP subunit
MILITVMLFVALISSSGCSEKKNGDAVAASAVRDNEHSTYVKASEAKIKDIMSFIDFSGVLFSETSANIAPDITVKVIKYHVSKGDFVHKNTKLATMDSTQYIQARIQFENAEKNYYRMLELKKGGSIDDQTFDQVEAAYKAAKAAYEFQKKNKEIVAPFSGYITSKLVNEGEVYNAMSGRGILRMISIETLKLKIQITDIDIGKINKGQKAIITTDSYPDKEFIGHVSFIPQEADNMSGTFNCDISVNNSDNNLKPNQFARARIILKKEPDALVIPQSSIVNGNKECI